jgi:hypothetical protein
LEIAERHTLAALVEQSEGALSAPVAKILAQSLTAVFSVIIDEIGQAMKDGGDLSVVIESLRAHVYVALHHLATGHICGLNPMSRARRRKLRRMLPM